MNYYISRDGQQFGPYTLAEVQRYVADGNILLTDLAHSEGMEQWVPVRQILGNIPVQPAAPGPVAPNYGQVPVYPQQPVVFAQPAGSASGPLPPDLHWALVLAIGVFCGIFLPIWMFIQAGYVKKLRPDAKCMLLYGMGVGGIVLGYVVIGVASVGKDNNLMALAGFILIGAGVLIMVGHFSLRRSLLDYFNSTEPLNLRLSPVMTFFFNVIYFQYHFNRIRQYKVTGIWR
jgi:hypothetical protein